ncbi:hypothetical protein GDO81_021269 [Engystomops pustulosus]|uniref:Uncharacterized protein n=1 Tax=Engystomops pustulosus TaxID=76066 RepID=A0AAV6YW33_ENGPU|nr:hypothetical protein GDO81_021269 [Engystomops pustulosus]
MSCKAITGLVAETQWLHHSCSHVNRNQQVAPERLHWNSKKGYRQGMLLLIFYPIIYFIPMPEIKTSKVCWTPLCMKCFKKHLWHIEGF